MNHHFDDITSRLGTPVWYDQLGYPRYCSFGPEVTSNIYSDMVLLVRLGCQGCDEELLVGNSYSATSLMLGNLGRELVERINERSGLSKFVFAEVSEEFISKMNKEDWIWLASYGDPPNHGCVGDTMGSYALKIEECWIKDKKQWKWERHPEYEIELETRD